MVENWYLAAESRVQTAISSTVGLTLLHTVIVKDVWRRDPHILVSSAVIHNQKLSGRPMPNTSVAFQWNYSHCRNTYYINWRVPPSHSSFSFKCQTHRKNSVIRSSSDKEPVVNINRPSSLSWRTALASLPVETSSVPLQHQTRKTRLNASMSVSFAVGSEEYWVCKCKSVAFQ